MAITLVRGDITTQEVDVIVNAANSSLLGGGGVDGAIHKAGGPKILEACRAIRARQGECKIGEAVITPGGNLLARYVIHTVGPVWQGGDRGEPQLLENCYRNSLLLAQACGLSTIAFPCISTGVYRYPIEGAASIALATVCECLQTLKLAEVRFVVFLERDLEVYQKLLNAV